MLTHSLPATRSVILLSVAVAVNVACGLTVSLAQQVDPIRIATYNASLYGRKADEVRDRLSDGKDSQAEKVAAIVQTIRPDVLLVNEIDFDSQSEVANTLAEKFFAVPQGDRKAIDYPYVRSFASNTGVDSGLDLNNNGRAGDPQDAWGFGVYPGQYSFAVFSRFPIKDDAIRTFQQFLWKDLPGALKPVNPKTQQSYYEAKTWAKLRLSSKNHVDIPIQIGEWTLHVLASHPVPPVFDGPEDRNGCRNHDEIRFWSEYLGGNSSDYLVDDQGRAGGLARDQSFVIMGDLNSDPTEGDSRSEAISRLLADPRVNDPLPRSAGAVEEAARSKRKREGDPALHTASFSGNRNMRIDYVLPSRSLPLRACGVHWPKKGDADHEFIGASDHRMVWIEVDSPAAGRP